MEEGISSLNAYRGLVRVDMDAIISNMEAMRANINEKTGMMAVIKADGYGHGSVELARVFEDIDYVKGYAVATAEEAQILRNAGIKKPVLIIGYAFPYCYGTMIKEDVRLTVFREDSLKQIDSAARTLSMKARIHIPVDTGMGRIGVLPDDAGLAFVKKTLSFENIILEGVFTHFARADERDKSSAKMQYEKFKGFTDRIERELSYRIPIKHCSNSAAILEMPYANMDMVRSGITMYGLMPSDEVPDKAKALVKLKPALSLISHIVYVKTIHKGDSVSYGGTFTADKDVRLATIPLGYADGIPRSLSNKGYVLIRGKRAPITGRVCMDQFMVDVSDIEGAREDDEVVIIGESGNEKITAEDVGALSGRFNYELVCDINIRLPRAYYRNGRLIGRKDYGGTVNG